MFEKLNSDQYNENMTESFFSVDELFVSRTNKQGHILAGNNVFVRVSEFSKNQLLNRPHNIIRHADMPKAVFKLLWNEIGQGNVFCGYVKNQSKLGKFYWVLAIVFPVSDGYISVQLKPTSPLLDVVKKLYQEEINGQVRSINEATQQQEIGIQQTNVAMKQVDVTSQGNTESASTALRQANELKQKSELLERANSRLSFLIRGKEIKYHSSEQYHQPNNNIESLVSKLVTKNENQFQNYDLDKVTADDPDFKKMVS